jgi:hypothetical protein
MVSDDTTNVLSAEAPAGTAPATPPKKFKAETIGEGQNRHFQITYFGRKSQESILLDRPTALHKWVQRGLIKEPPSFSLIFGEKARVIGVFMEGAKILHDSPQACEILEESFINLTPKVSAEPAPSAGRKTMASTMATSATVTYIKVKRVGFSFKLVFDTTFTKDHEMTLEEGMKYLEDHNVLRPYVLVKVSTHLKVHEQHADSYKDVPDGTIDLNVATEKQVEEFFNRFLAGTSGAGGGRKKRDPRVMDWVTEEDAPVFSVADDRGGHFILACRIGKSLKFDLALTAFNAKRVKSEVAIVLPTVNVSVAFPLITIEDRCDPQAIKASEFTIRDVHSAQAFSEGLNALVQRYAQWAREIMSQAEVVAPPGLAPVPAPKMAPAEEVRGAPESVPAADPIGAPAPRSAPVPAPEPAASIPLPAAPPAPVCVAPEPAAPEPPLVAPASPPPEPGRNLSVEARFLNNGRLEAWSQTNRHIFEALSTHLGIPALINEQGYQVLNLSEVTDKTSADFSGFVLGPSGGFVFRCWGEYARFGFEVFLHSAKEPDLFEAPGPALLGVAVHRRDQKEDITFVILEELGEKLEKGAGKKCRDQLGTFLRLVTPRELGLNLEGYEILWPA